MPAVLVYKADCYAELAVSSPAAAKTIASTHCNDLSSISCVLVYGL